MIKTILKRYITRTAMSILIIASVVAIIKTSVLHETLKNIAACACLMVSWLCARAVWPRKVADEPVTQPIPMPSVPDPITQPLPAIEVTYRNALEDAFKDDDGYWSNGVEV